MPKPPLENINPLDIFMQARGFFVAEDALGKLTAGPDVQLGSHLVQANMVLSSLTTELFLKCLVCIETKLTPQGHHLSELFKLLSPTTASQIIDLWDSKIVPAREAMWDMIEKNIRGSGGEKLKRDLPGALLAANRAFERMRYSYEPESRTTTFIIGDVPRILHRVILERKPEWANLGRNVTALSEVQPRHK